MKTCALAAAVLVMAPALASAQMSVARSASFAGQNEISTQLGFQASMGGGTPSGAKLFIDYSRHLKSFVWLNAKLNPTFSAEGRRVCYDNLGPYDCGIGLDGNGHAIDALIGVKLKFPTRNPHIVPYANINVGVVGVFSRPGNDDGAAGVIHTGGGLRYFLTPHVALGGEMNFTLGGAHYTESCRGCGNDHNEFYRAFDMGMGAEFIL